MNPPEIIARRLANQRLLREPFPTPDAAVRHLGALQSQDYAGAKWALSLRTGNPGYGDTRLDTLYDAGKVLRTHLMRTTWHFVAPEDIRWMTGLLAPRGRQAMAFMNRKEGLTTGDFNRSKKILEKSLRDRTYKTRNELAEDFRKGDVAPGEGIRLAHLMMDAELEGLVTSGPRRGKQFTYALLDERLDDRAPSGSDSFASGDLISAHTFKTRADSTSSVTDGKVRRPVVELVETTARTLNNPIRDEALAELALRYFTGHGPAQAADFAWWSGLTLTEVKKGIEGAKSGLESVTVGGKAFWWGRGNTEHNFTTEGAKRNTKVAKKDPVVHLLPNYDEYFIAYKDRTAIGGRVAALKTKPPEKMFFQHILFVDGQVAGGWKREVGKEAVLEVTPAGKLSVSEKKALLAEAARFGVFAGTPCRLDLKG